MLNVKEGIEQHLGHFQPNQCYIPYSENLRNSVKYSKNPVNNPFKCNAPGSQGTNRGAQVSLTKMGQTYHDTNTVFNSDFMRIPMSQ